MASDLRQFLAEIDDVLIRVKRPVDLDRISAPIVDAKQPILFEEITGYPGWKLCDLFFRDRACQARVLRTEPGRVLPELWQRMSLPPRRVSNGPVRQRVLKGDQLDLKSLPGFQHGEHDGGRVVIAMTLCRDPDSGHPNLAYTRMTPLTPTRATYFIGSSSHMRSALEKHEKANTPMPFAFVVGTHPAYEIMGSYTVPTHLEKFGYYHPGVTKQPVFDATAIPLREDPILRQVNTILFSDHQPLISLPHEAILYERLRELGIRVHDVQYVPWGETLSCVIKMTPEYDGQVTDMLMHVLGQRWPNAKMVVAVDDDIDIEDPGELYWCLATRVDPERDVFSVPNARGHPGDPSARPLEGGPRRASVDKWGIDATKPPLSRASDRKRFDRCLPKHWGEVRLQNFLNGPRAPR